MEEDIPAPGLNKAPDLMIETIQNGVRVNYDILGLTYWMLTRAEEVGRTDLDNHSRFPSTSSHGHQNDYLETPVVDVWLEMLRQVSQQLWPSLSFIEHSFNFIVTHDVDRPSYYGFTYKSAFLSLVRDVLAKKSFFKACKRFFVSLGIRDHLTPIDPYSRMIGWLMDQSEQKGNKSIFYFLAGGNHIRYDADYDLGHPAIRKLMKEMHQRGHQLGLHPSYNTYNNPFRLKKESEYFKRICEEEGIIQEQPCGRMHYLRWQTPRTARLLADAGIKYDSSLSYADRSGFRCGTCREYPMFDPVEKDKIGLLESPLIVMENSILNEKYMDLGYGDAAFEKFMKLKNTCEKLGGNFVLLWHNSSFPTSDHQDLYVRVLSEMHRK